VTWIVSTSQAVVQRRWGDECILYDVDSGNTHLVTPLAAEVILRLQTHPDDMDGLTVFFAAGEAPSVLPEIRATLTIILEELERIDLVHRRPA